MAWTTPSTRAVGDMITAAIYNDEIINNIKMLRQPRIQVIPLAGNLMAFNDTTNAYGTVVGSMATFGASAFPTTGTVKLHFVSNPGAGGNAIVMQLYDIGSSAAVSGSPTTGTSAAGVAETIGGDILAGFTTGVRQYVLQSRMRPASDAGAVLYAGWLQVEW